MPSPREAALSRGLVKKNLWKILRVGDGPGAEARRAARFAQPRLSQVVLPPNRRRVDAGEGGDDPSTGLKKTQRVIEKAQLRKEGDGRGRTDRVCDVVRAMVVATDMEAIAAIAGAFTALARAGVVKIVRLKDRFTSPQPGGWRCVCGAPNLRSPNRLAIPNPTRTLNLTLTPHPRRAAVVRLPVAET